jgi:hypothetical protein
MSSWDFLIILFCGLESVLSNYWSCINCTLVSPSFSSLFPPALLLYFILTQWFFSQAYCSHFYQFIFYDWNRSYRTYRFLIDWCFFSPLLSSLSSYVLLIIFYINRTGFRYVYCFPLLYVMSLQQLMTWEYGSYLLFLMYRFGGQHNNYELSPADDWCCL